MNVTIMSVMNFRKKRQLSFFVGYITYFIPFPRANKIKTVRTYSCLPSSSCSELWRVPSAAWVQEQALELGWFAEHGEGYTLITLDLSAYLGRSLLGPRHAVAVVVSLALALVATLSTSELFSLPLVLPRFP